MKTGDLISWEYIHHFMGRSRTIKVKHGEFIGEVKHKKHNGRPMAIVKFYGNKRNSIVPLSEIKEMETRRKNLIMAQKDICNTF